MAIRIRNGKRISVKGTLRNSVNRAKLVEKNIREIKSRVDDRMRTNCAKCDTAIESSVNGLCFACQQGKRHGSKK